MAVVPKCIFTGEDLGRATRPEHTIPRAIGGRIETASLVSTPFNNNAGATIDAVLVDAYQGVTWALAPELPSRVVGAGTTLSCLDRPQHRFRYDRWGEARTKGVHVHARGTDGRPIRWTDDGSASTQEIAARFGYESTAQAEGQLVLMDQLAKFPRPSRIISAELLAGMLKATICTAHENPGCGPDIVCSDALKPAREVVRASVETLLSKNALGYAGIEELFCGYLLGSEHVAVFRHLAKQAGHTATPFEHQVWAWSDHTSRALFAAFVLYGCDTWLFRLSTDWRGPPVAVLTTNGVIRGTRATHYATDSGESWRLSKLLSGTAPPLRHRVGSQEPMHEPHGAACAIMKRRSALSLEAINFAETHSAKTLQRTLTQDLAKIRRLEADARPIDALIFRMNARLGPSAVKATLPDPPTDCVAPEDMGVIYVAAFKRALQLGFSLPIPPIHDVEVRPQPDGDHGNAR